MLRAAAPEPPQGVAAGLSVVRPGCWPGRPESEVQARPATAAALPLLPESEVEVRAAAVAATATRVPESEVEVRAGAVRGVDAMVGAGVPLRGVKLYCQGGRLALLLPPPADLATGGECTEEAGEKVGVEVVLACQRRRRCSTLEGQPPLLPLLPAPEERALSPPDQVTRCSGEPTAPAAPRGDAGSDVVSSQGDA